MIGVYIPFGYHPTINYVDDPKLNVWELKCTMLSEIGINGKSEVRADLRRSKSMRDKFVIKRVPDYIAVYFEKIHIGIGSMHVYESGDFMKPHVDGRSHDYQGLPHVMTLVISDDMSPLRINGHRLNSDTKAVLFSLDCKHEVLPVKTARRSFTFPVYGIYNPFYTYKQNRADGKNIYDAVLQYIDSTDPESKDLRPLIGAVNGLEVISTELLEALHDFNGGVWINDNPKVKLEVITEFYVNYTMDEIEYNDKVTDDLIIPTATNVTFEKRATHPGVEVFEKLKTAIRIKKKKAEEHYACICKHEVKELPDCVLDTLPNHPVIILLFGRYFGDSTLESLIPEDKVIYDLLVKKKKVSFSVITVPSDYDQCYMELINDKFVDFRSKDRATGHLPVNGFRTEFDDMNSFDACFEVCYGALIVE